MMQQLFVTRGLRAIVAAMEEPMRRLRNLVAAVVLIPAAVAVVGAQVPWLSEDAAMRLAIQLTERFEAIEQRPPIDRAGRISSARARIEHLRTRIGAANLQGLIDRAPAPAAGISLPLTDDARLKAMVRYHLCNIVAVHQFERDAADSVRAAGAIGLTALTVVQARLLAPYLADGGSVAAIESTMTGPGMSRVLEAMQADRELFDRVSGTCAPIVADLLAALS
jgi:hypothetical protein